MSNEKKYTAEEVAKKVLERAHQLIKKSELAKANTSHEIEAGEEPNNDDAEAPEYLANADIEGDGDRKAKKKKAKPDSDEDDVSEEEAAAMEDIAEEEIDEHNDHLHEGQEHEEAEGHEDSYGEDEEPGEESEEVPDDDDAVQGDPKKVVKDATKDDKEKKKPFGKSENGLQKLKKFVELKKSEHEKGVQKPYSGDKGSGVSTAGKNVRSIGQRLGDKESRLDAAKRSIKAHGEDRKKQPKPNLPKSEHAYKDKDVKKKQSVKKKDKKLEKFLGVKPKQEKQKPVGTQNQLIDSGIKGF